MRLILRLHPDEYTALRDDDREWIENLGYEIWCDPYGTKPGCATIMDISPLMETLKRNAERYYDSVVFGDYHDHYNAPETHTEAF